MNDRERAEILLRKLAPVGCQCFDSFGFISPYLKEGLVRGTYTDE